jgi:hypothetical protein
VIAGSILCHDSTASQIRAALNAEYARLMKRLLMIAYHFPPFAGSSGVQRALSFSSYLPEHGWEPIVLTAHPRAYERTSDDLLDQVRPGTRVIRASAWDTKRHLAIGGRYPAFMARPDRWRWWWLGAVPAGLWAIARYRPAAIWSTYPIATAHQIGATLAQISRLPLLADFRDPMAQDGYPSDPATWRSFERIERRTLAVARCSTFTTPGSVELYRRRYPQYDGRLALLENGYDDATFSDATTQAPLTPNRLTLLHSGVVYPSERDPTQLFAALVEMRRRSPALFARLVVRFRAPVEEGLLRELSLRYDLAECVEVLPAVGHRAAVDEMCRADGLLILQANNCNAQIPAKFYEYLRATRPMLVLADPPGDTAGAARAAGIGAIAALEDAAGIGSLLERFVTSPEDGTLPAGDAVASASRRARTAELAVLLNEMVGARA